MSFSNHKFVDKHLNHPRTFVIELSNGFWGKYKKVTDKTEAKTFKTFNSAREEAIEHFEIHQFKIQSI